MSAPRPSRERQRGRSGNFWPSELAEGLLIAALGNPRDAVDAWQDLVPGFDLEELEPGCFDLLALIYRRLSASGYHDPVLERLKGVYRREWVRANVLLERTKEIATTLQAAHVDALLIEGTPLADRYFSAPGLRPSWFVDVFVAKSTARPALAALAEAGWSAQTPPDLDAAGRWALFNRDRSVCVLRTSLSSDFAVPGGRSDPYAPLWEAAERYDLGGTEILVPEPHWALLATCVFGARWHPRTNLQWIVDAVMILRKETIDVALLAELGRARGQTLRLREALTYLSAFPDVRISEHDLVELDSARVTSRERLGYALAAGSFRSAGSLSSHAASHLAASSGASLAGAAVTFPEYLRREWDVSHRWELPYAAGQRAFRRLRARRRSL